MDSGLSPLHGGWPLSWALRCGDNQGQVLASKELTVMSALVGSVVLSTAASQLLTARRQGREEAAVRISQGT